MILQGITKDKLLSLGVEMHDEFWCNLNPNHSLNDTTISDEGIFYTPYAEMRSITLGALFFYKLTNKELTRYTLYLNGKKIDFIDSVYALEKLVETAESVVLVKTIGIDGEKIPWIIKKENND